MDPFSEKRLRGQKRQRSYNKKAYMSRDKSSKAEGSNSSNQHDSVEPQPQRENRRDRNEHRPTTNEVESPSSNVPAKTEAQQPDVDHSHLKRETEEIEKLTKKFSRREISSNWNRYVVTENIATDAPAEEEALADFCDLLQLPPSRGGHLQLKEEQDWASVSDALLNGYFALDLEVLSRGLACIPAYERLQLPKRIFTEDEVDSFDKVAEQAKQCYKGGKIEDPKRNICLLLKKFVIEEAGPKQVPEFENNTNHAEEVFNILDLNKSKKLLLNLDISSDSDKYSSETLVNDTKAFENMLTSSVNKSTNVVQNSFLTESKEQRNKKGYAVTENSKTTLKLDSNSIHSDERKKSVKENEESLDSTTVVNMPPISFKTVVNDNISLATSVCSNSVTKKETSPVAENKTGNAERLILDINESSSKHCQAIKTVSPAKEIKTNISASTAMNLEDDDDLDFLLALKTPVSSQKVKQNNSTAAFVKDSSFLPGGGTTVQSAAAETQSELDSWLDSVLQD